MDHYVPRRNQSRHGIVVLVGWVSLIGCAPRDSDVEARASAIINGTPVSTDPAGYSYLTDSTVFASGVFLAPNWVLTAGHFLADNDGQFRSSWGSPGVVSAYVGTTTNGFQATPYAHPNWWAPLLPPPPLGLRDFGFDVGLVHLNNAWANTGGYASRLFNQLSNDWVWSTIRCYGYGQTNLNGTGGGLGYCRPRTST
jgi:hypothetical protein